MATAYYVPASKYELINILHSYYPNTSTTEFNKLSEKQLYAVYFRTRLKKEKIQNEKSKV